MKLRYMSLKKLILKEINSINLKDILKNIFFAFLFLISCKREIYINDIVSIPKENVLNIPNTLELIAPGKVRVKATGNHEISLSNRKIIISVKSLLNDASEEKIDKILLPKNRVIYYLVLIFSLIVSFVFLFFVLFPIFRKKKRLIKAFAKYKREINRDEMFALTLLFREYVEDKFGIRRGISLEILLKELKDKIYGIKNKKSKTNKSMTKKVIEENILVKEDKKVDMLEEFSVIERFLKEIEHPKYSGQEKSLSAVEFISCLEKIDDSI